MAMVGRMRRLHYRQNRPLREIARMTSLSRNTIRKYLKGDVASEPKSPFFPLLIRELHLRRLESR